jgi:hypothetical protein
VKFTIVRLNSHKGVEIVWRNVLTTTWQLEQSQGWECSAVEHGVLALHSTREQPLFLPWSMVASCDVAPAEKMLGKKAS